LCMFFEGVIRQDEYNKKGVCIIWNILKFIIMMVYMLKQLHL
jgi:hypothetical protein